MVIITTPEKITLQAQTSGLNLSQVEWIENGQVIQTGGDLQLSFDFGDADRKISARVTDEFGREATDSVTIKTKKPKIPELSISGPNKVNLDTPVTLTSSVKVFTDSRSEIEWFDKNNNESLGFGDSIEVVFQNTGKFTIEAVVSDQFDRTVKNEITITVVKPTPDQPPAEEPTQPPAEEPTPQQPKKDKKKGLAIIGSTLGTFLTSVLVSR